MAFPMEATMEAMVAMVAMVVTMVAILIMVVSGISAAATESVMFVNIYILCKLHRI